MKKILIAFAALSLVGSVSLATGGIDCSGETHGGTKIEISACVPHGIMGICSDLKIFKNGTEALVIPRDQVSGFYSSINFSGLMAYDAEMNETLVQLEYFEKNNKKNSLKVKLEGKEYKFKDVTCNFE